MKTKYISLLLAALILMACERDTNVPLPEHKSRLVVYAMLTAGTNPEVYVTKSVSLNTQLNDKNVLVADATVELFENDSSVGNLIYEETTRKDTTFWGEISDKVTGVYTADNLTISGGKEYELKISHKDFESISAKTTVKALPTISNIRIEENADTKTDEEGYTISQTLIHMDITQAANMSNYYRLGLVSTTTYEDPFNEEEFTQDVFYNTEGPAVKDVDGYKAESPFFSGIGKEGQTLTVSFLLNLYSDTGGTTFFEDAEDLDLVLFSINEEGKKFTETFNRQIDAEELADIPIFPRESVVVFSNVENGYGIVGEISRVIEKLK